MKAVQTVQLSAQLPGDLDLADLNRRLHAGEIELDWSQVEPGVTSTYLRVLLAGLNLSEHIDIIGAGTIAEALQPAILAILNTGPKQNAQRSNQQSGEVPQNADVPELWQPVEVPRMEDEEEKEAMATTTQKLTAVRKPLLVAPAAAELRAKLETMVVRDLLGPAGGTEEEVTDDHVYERYLTGMLAPSDMPIDRDELDNNESLENAPDEHGTADLDNAPAASLSPSSMGLSFRVGLEVSHIQVTASWGHYQRVEPAHQGTEKGKTQRVWKRTQRQASQSLTLQEGRFERWWHPVAEQPEVFVESIVRRKEDCWLVTLFLVNGQKKPKRVIDRAWLFQPALSVETSNGAPLFRGQVAEPPASLKQEDRPLAMLYRRQINFAVGHGVSTHVITKPGDSTTALRVATTFIPTYDVPLTEAPSLQELPGLTELCLDMRVLAETPAQKLRELLQPLLTTYEAWIEEQTSAIDDPAMELHVFRTEAEEAIQHCRRTLGRIQVGIDLLESNPQAARAFAFLNRAMWQQRIHTMYAEERRNGGQRGLEVLDQPSNRSWRPFQLAFILLNLPPLTIPTHPNRSSSASAIADLLWFPTGGGKTEAYLGLTAYTLAIRRLQGTVAGRSGLDGVAVIMRYTLRLLTLQQFQRAAALMCACEMIRREEGSAQWGETPFRLGLWVGLRATPNTTAESDDAITEERGAVHHHVSRSGSPRQLTHCPWCGSPIDGGVNLTVNKERQRTLIYCSAPFSTCPFNKVSAPQEGLPVLVVDEEIYRFLPALLIATVDKFAQLPWKGETQMLFGQVDRYCERHGFLSPDIAHASTHQASGTWPRTTVQSHASLRPPDLIIQDELHLISGPLGTMVGLYETAIDHLATWEIDGRQVRPKVIAATATIRQASNQIQALFMRKVNIFPPQGLDVADNFFSRQREPSNEQPGRRYLGICAHGKRLKAAEIRVYLAYLSAAQQLFENYGPAADPWMTLVGYFNSIRELGGMRHMVDDDVKNRLWRMNQRGLARRSLHKVQELTSRLSTSDIPDVLSMLELGFSPENVTSTKNSGKANQQKINPIDVLLATNMISVGVDIKRLGLMVVTGQPKTTAEYIQATSRVGRSYPGMVCVIYNWARPRDLSHYEQFEHYHATFYQQVEALSVTPFAPRALDRGLAALLTSIVRLSGPHLNRNTSAGQLTTTTPELASALAAIIRRVEEIDPDALDDTSLDLEKLSQHWLRMAAEIPGLGYQQEKNGITLPLLKVPERGQWEPFTCLNSLRNVEPNVRLILDDRSLDYSEIEFTETAATAEETPAEEMEA